MLCPYIGRISVTVVSEISTNPDYLVQLCNFLVCSRNEQALQKVAQELKKSPVSFVTTPEVLSHVFLLETREGTELVLGFILDLLMRSRKNATEPITVLMIVKSTVVPLLGELVIYMGESDAGQANKVIEVSYYYSYIFIKFL